MSRTKGMLLGAILYGLVAGFVNAPLLTLFIIGSAFVIASITTTSGDGDGREG